jgi:hypothetical protein
MLNPKLKFVGFDVGFQRMVFMSSIIRSWRISQSKWIYQNISPALHFPHSIPSTLTTVFRHEAASESSMILTL